MSRYTSASQVFVCALLLSTAAVLAAQQTKAPNPYEGTSNPPPDSTITTPAPQPPAKPAPGKPMNPAPAQPQAAPAPGLETVPDIVTGPDTASEPGTASPDATNGTDDGIVQVETSAPGQPALDHRAETAESADPDGDIVHPAPLPPGTLSEGTTIRARLLDRLSTSYSQDGERFRARVASDVLRDGQVLIPAGAEIDGAVVHVSTGHFAGHGSMLLRPETVILPDGSHYRLYAQLTATPDSNTRVGSEGTVAPGSRAKKDGIEYGGGVGVGAVAGAALGGPAGALAGTIIGAGAVTVHLLMDHPQATLESGTVLDFTLTEPLTLVATNTPASAPGTE